MSQLSLFVFGPPRLVRGEDAVEISLRKDIALLVYLAVTRQPHSRDALATLLWPDSDQQTGRSNLRRALYRLNKRLQVDLLAATNKTVEINAEAGLWVDVEAYEAHVAACLPRDESASMEDECISRLGEAVDLYTDDFLAGFTLPDSPEFDEWQFFRTESLRQSLAEVLEHLMVAQQVRGDFDQAITFARRRLALDPLHEPAHRDLMRLYAWTDRHAAAIRQYEECVRILDEEFGVPPEDETDELYEAIRTKRLPAPSTLPRGSRGLADAVLVATAPRIVSLPLDVAPFVGRREELDRIGELLRDPDCRLLTIVGLGGIGKTRLSVAAGRRAAEDDAALFPDGVVFVPLAGVESGDAIPSALAGALNIPLAGQVDPLTEVSNHLADKAMLLILDNFEQLAESAELLTELLAAGPDVTLLVTSREPLYVSAEWRLDVDGLPYPVGIGGCTAEEIRDFEAVQLFVQTAQQVRSDFVLTDEEAPHVCRLCRLVAGMPLALKLAATWLRVMPCERIVDEVERDLDVLTSRLRDVPARQRSMRVIFENTWDLLPPDEQRAFAALSVFRGSFTEEAADEVANVSPWLLAGLMDRGLVQHAGESRYTIHELTRQFAAEKRASADTAGSIPRRQSEYYLELVIAHDDELCGENPVRAVATLKDDLDNIRQAWQRAIADGHIDVIARVIEPLATFYELAGLLQEGERSFRSAAETFETRFANGEAHAVICRLLLKRITFAINRGYISGVWEHADRVRTLAEEGDDALLLADTRTVCGFAYRYTGQLKRAITELEEAVAVYEAHDRRQSLIFALNLLGESKARLQGQKAALADHRRALEIATELGDLRGRALSLSYIGGDYYFTDEYKTALSYFEQAVALFEQVNDVLGGARTIANVGFIHCLLGNYDDAQYHVQRAIPMLRNIGAQESEAYALDTMALVYFGQGHYARGQQAFETALNFVLETDQRLEEGWIRNHMSRLELAMGRYDVAEEHLRRAMESLEAVGSAREIAITHGNLGTLYVHRGEMDRALEAYDRALSGLRETGARYHLAHFLIEKGQVLLDRGDLPTAESLVQEGLDVATWLGRRPTIFEAELLLARIAHADGRADGAVERLHTLLDTATTEAEKAAAHYELWTMDDDRAHGRHALDLYRRLAEETPNVTYRQRLHELQAAVTA